MSETSTRGNGHCGSGTFDALPSRIAFARAYNAQAQNRFSDVVKYANKALDLAPKNDDFMSVQISALAERGIVIKSGRGEESGLHGIVLHDDGRTEGAAGPRREGIFRAVH